MRVEFRGQDKKEILSSILDRGLSQETKKLCLLASGKSFQRLKRKREENILFFHEPLPESS